MRISDWSSDVVSSDLAKAGGPTCLNETGRSGNNNPVRTRSGFRSGNSILPPSRPGHAGNLPCRQNRARSSRQYRVRTRARSEEHTSELQSLMRISYAVFCLKKKNTSLVLVTNLKWTAYSQQCIQLRI